MYFVTKAIQPLHVRDILRKEDNLPGIKIGGKNFMNLSYADDTVFVAESAEELQKIVELVNEESPKKDLNMNAKKDKTYRCL